MIKLQIIGRLGGDCVTNEVGGKNVINFNVANTEKFKNSQGTMQERTTWVRCAYWTERTAVAAYLKKGQLVYVEGTPEVQAYKRQDGEPGASLRMRVMRVELLGSRADAQANAGNDSLQSSDSEGNDDPVSQIADEEGGIDDLPF